MKALYRLVINLATCKCRLAFNCFGILGIVCNKSRYTGKVNIERGHPRGLVIHDTSAVPVLCKITVDSRKLPF